MKKSILISAMLITFVAVGCNKTLPSYSLADVKLHNTASDCWLAVNGSVYDATSFIPRHPGGSDRIIPLCGTDATTSFTEKHEGDQLPEAQLESLKIGTMK